MPDNASILLIWDGDCGFCRNALGWMLQHDHAGRIEAVPYQALPSPPMTPALYRQAEQAVQVVTPEGQQLSGGRAVLYVLRQVGWRPALVRLASRWPFVWVVELGYRVIARNRTLFSRFLFRTGGKPGCGGEKVTG